MPSFGAYEPRPDGVNDPVHCWEQRGGSRPFQVADGREGGLVEEGPRAARRVVQGGGMRRVRPHPCACYQAPDGRL